MLASAHRFRRSTILALGLIAVLPRATQVHAQSSRTLPAGKVTAEYALAHYSDAVVRTLADLVAFPTVHEEGRSNQDLASFKAMTAYLKQSAERLGLDFTDAGAVIVIGMGRGDHRLGLLTHGDVQPADATKWAKSPFSLDSRSRAGRLIGRGTEDDKGPIAAALFAMKAVKDQGLPLTRRIELIISYTEESDWDPFTDYLSKNPPPDLNVSLDAEYPVVVAEKGWVSFRLRVTGSEPGGNAHLLRFEGGAFLSQVPEDALAEIRGADAALTARLRAAADEDHAVRYTFDSTPTALTIRARGVSAHSSKPWEGTNAITHLAGILATVSWPPTPAGNAVRLVHELVGTGYEAKEFGKIAYADAFMGPLTLSLGTVRREGDFVDLGINLRRPTGKSAATLELEIRDAVGAWQVASGARAEIADLVVFDPYDARQAPHVPILLDIFQAFTGASVAAPISIGGGTHARLVPNGVNFGPVMPGEPYTGHAENEYIKRKDLMASLEMYAAMIERLATLEVTTAMPENAPTHAPTAASPAERADVANPRRVEQPWMSLADWRQLHETQLNSPERKSARLVFLGDSIANGWVGSEAFRNRFAPLSPMSLGIGGDQTQHLLWRIEDGALAGLEPRLMVLLIGVNNLGNGFSPEETAAGVRAVVRAARQRLPKTPILLLSILPAGATPTDSLREKIQATNPFLAGLAEPGSVTLVDLATVPLEADGTISTETMADFLHPTAKGYERLTDALAPFVERLVAP